MINNNNPAGRLLNILRNAKHISGGTVVEAWAKVFGLDTSSYQEIIFHIYQLYELIEDIRNQINQIEDINHDLHLKYLADIEKVLSIHSFDASWVQSSKPYLTDVVFHNLELCSDRLSRISSEKIIEQKEILEFKEEVDALFEKIKDSATLKEELKSIILDQLEVIRRALTEYEIRGASGLRDALRRNLGEILLQNELFKNAKEKEEAKGFWEVVCKLDRISSAALKGQQLLEKYGPYLALLSK